MKTSAFVSFLCAAALSCVLSSCGPSQYVLSLQKMNPSASGLSLSGKSMSVFFAKINQVDSALFSDLALSFADKMSGEYRCDSVPVFCVEAPGDVDVVKRETMIDYLNLAQSDVVFLFQPGFETGDPKEYSYNFYAFDSMDSQDKVLIIRSLTAGKDNSSSSSYNTIVDTFSPRWITGNYVLFSFGDEKWDSALKDAWGGNWTNAIKKWTDILSGCKAMTKRSCAEFNIAVGCYLLGEKSLAEKWLERARQDGLTKLEMTPEWP